MKSFGWMVMSSLAVFLVATPTSWAQETASAREDCGQVVNAAGETETSISCCMEELLAAQDNMIDALSGVIIEVQGMNLSSISAEGFALRQSAMGDLMAKIQFLRDEHERAVAGNEAVEDADYEEAFANADQEKGKKCKLSDKPFVEALFEFDSREDGLASIGLKLDGLGSKFDDGTCNIFKAVDLDGNDVKVNERKENMCELVCEDRMNMGMGNRPRKEERKERVVGRLTDGIAETVRATGRITEARANLTALRLQLSSVDFSSSTTSDICVSGADSSDDFAIVVAAISLANSAASFITVGLEIAKDIAEPPANQTVAGFNGGSAVVPFAVAAGISKLVTEVLGAAEKLVVLLGEIASADREDTLEVCLKSVRDNLDSVKDDTDILKGEFEEPDGAIVILQGDVDDLKISAGETEEALTAIQMELDEMKVLLKETRDLLLTPPGRREGFKLNP